MESWLVSFVTAAFLSLLWTSLPTVPLIAIMLLIALACCCLKSFRYPLARNCISGLCLGSVWMASVGHWQKEWQVPKDYFQQEVEVVGEIVDLQHADKPGRFNLKVEKIGNRTYWLKPIIRLRWYQQALPLQQGQRVHASVMLKPIHGLANQGGFQYQQWLFSQGIVATGYVKSWLNEADASDSAAPDAQASYRQQVADRFYQLALTHQAWLAALSFGDRGLFEPQDWQLIQHSGVAHLFAISGLHLSLIATFCFFLFASLLAGLQSLMGRHLGQLRISPYLALYGGLAITLVFTFGYAWLAGLALPVLRAWLMLLLVAFLVFSKRIWNLSTLLLVALFLFILLFPLSLFGISFWLSFAAVITIGFISWRWPSKRQGLNVRFILAVMVRTQVALSLLMLPMIGFQFGLIAWLAPLTNLIAVPFVTLFMLPLCLLATLALIFSVEWGQWLFSAADAVMAIGLQGLEWTTQFSWSYLHILPAPWYAWLLAIIALVVFLLPGFVVKRAYFALLLLPLISYQLPQKSILASQMSERWQVDVLDVGQGLSILISRNHHAILYDTGASYPSGFNMADAVILPLLKSRGINQLDMVFISHSDNDHAGSLEQLKAQVPIGQVMDTTHGCDASLAMQWQGLSLGGLWPIRPYESRFSKDTNQVEQGNDSSCVLMVSDGKHRLLLPGDISQSVEQLLIDKPLMAQADILIAPHHGSNTSSSSAFIHAVSPKYVVFTQGFMNRWGFPKEDVVERYRRHSQAQHYLSSEHGQVSFRLDPTGEIQVRTFRQHIYPYWYAN